VRHSSAVVRTSCGVEPGVNRKALGEMGEGWAREHLERIGYRVRETNFRCREGEIDIIADHKGCLVFVEVRTKTGSAFGTPEESVTAAKQEKLVSVAMSYLQTHDGLPSEWRIDVVAIEVSPKGRVIRTELIQNAVS
jgi:putative endonuclease